MKNKQQGPPSHVKLCELYRWHRCLPFRVLLVNVCISWYAWAHRLKIKWSTHLTSKDFSGNFFYPSQNGPLLSEINWSQWNKRATCMWCNALWLCIMSPGKKGMSYVPLLCKAMKPFHCQILAIFVAKRICMKSSNWAHGLRSNVEYR